MGIPHLTSTLEPYATLSPLNGQAVVIDGPALAYHILNICRANGLAYPEPDVLGSTAVQWLDGLTSRSVVIKAIYFDGFLPPSKEPVRMERMARNTTQLKQFFSSNPRGCPNNYFSTSSGHSELNLFASGRLDGRPPLTPTFLVPAVTDALRQNLTYQGIVHLVPAEADAYCAQHLAENGGIVLTSDSDLLAHDLGNGKVVFFRDVHLDAQAQLASATFDPAHICTRLGLKSTDACRFAYERKRLPHSSLPQLVQACLQPLDNDGEYHQFCQQYLCHETGTLPTTTRGNLLRLDHLDPRLSELILRLDQHKSDHAQPKAELRMFLPVLLESPARGSAWEPSTSIRVLAYTLSRCVVPGSDSNVLEYRRVQNLDQKGRQLSMLPKASMESAIVELLNVIRQLRSSCRGDKQSSFWLLLFLVLDVKDREDTGKESFVLRMLQASSGSFRAKRRQVAWDNVHLIAHLQAMWYSLRILSQVLLMMPDDLAESFSAAAWQLKEALSGLPLTAQSPELGQILAWLGSTGQSNTMTTLANFVNLSHLTPNAAHRSSKNEQRKGDAGASRSPNLAESSSKSNKFSLLATD